MRSGFYSGDSPTAAELISDSDDNLFGKVLNNKTHVLRKLLPERSTHDYNLRLRSHDRSLNAITDNKNFFNPPTTANFYTHPIPLVSTLTPICFLHIATPFCT